MQEASDARDTGDREREEYAQTMVDCFASQLNESNPILTEISEAMTEEGRCQEALSSLESDSHQKELWERKRNEAVARKERSNAKLMDCSSRYNQKMREIRQGRVRR